MRLHSLYPGTSRSHRLRLRSRRLVAVGLAVGVSVAGGLAVVAPAHAASRTFVGLSVTGRGDGYGLVANSGENYDFGTVIYHGNATHFKGSIVGVAVTPDGQGYVEVSSTGQVYAYGTVHYWGNPTGFAGSITGISVTADGQGYIVVSSAGQNYAYGTVKSWGNPTNFSGTIVGVSVTADGQGYANVSSAGQNYDYGTVQSWGNPTNFSGTIVGVSVTADGQGYANLSSAGQVYAFGAQQYLGNGDPGSNLGNSIASLATREAADSTHNREIPPGSNCNFYSSMLKSGQLLKECNGWFSEEWCADFARWVWGASGADTSGLNAGAISFTRYGGAKHFVWGSNLVGVAPGDVIGWKLNGSTVVNHVSIVVSVNDNGTITTIAGNSGKPARYVTTSIITPGAKVFAGYAAPLG